MDSINPPPEAAIFGKELNQYLVDLFGETRTQALASALCKPGGFFHLRTNTLRTTNDKLVAQLNNENISAEIIEPNLNAVALPIHKMGSVPLHDQVILADKASSENVLIGSHLYRPGVKRFDRFSQGDAVTVVNPKGHIVGSGIAAVDSKKIPGLKQGLVVEITNTYYDLPSIADLSAFQEGLFYSQSLSAMLVAPILAPQNGEIIIDLCAAPGGKSTHIAQLVENQCQLIAVDRSERRLNHLLTEAERLGTTCITPFVGRAKDFVMKHPKIQADRVLVDPPCTALGVRPKLFDETTLARIQSTASYQRMILDSAISVLRPQGILVYSTCTLTIEENELNIQHLIDNNGFTLESQTPYIGSRGIAGDSQVKAHVQRLFPDVHDLPGYFIAKLRKPG
ncbi:MAG: PUA domain-containing protein [Candidatus Hermodarchaeia archaeon]